MNQTGKQALMQAIIKQKGAIQKPELKSGKGMREESNRIPAMESRMKVLGELGFKGSWFSRPDG
jgi:hypothetical protein